MPRFLNAHDSSFVISEARGAIKHACRWCVGRGQSFLMALKFPSEKAACMSLSLPNETLIFIRSVCTRPASR